MTTLTLSQQCLDLIKEYEGYSAVPYKCSAGVPTIGYGATWYPDSGKKVTMQDKSITKTTANAMLKSMVQSYADAVQRYVQVPISQNQFDALVSLTYNIGKESFRTSTLLRLLNQRDYLGAADQFKRWNKDSGRIRSGLTRRRAAEKALFERNS